MTDLTAVELRELVVAELVPATDTVTVNEAVIVGAGSAGGGGSALTVKEEGTSVDTAVSSINFVGGSQTATQTASGAVTVTSTAYYPGGTDVPVTDGGTGSSTAAGARTNLSSERARTFHVSDYGTTGTSNDSTTFQAALTAAINAGGGTVYIPAGTYRVVNLYGGTGVKVKGEGRGVTTLKLIDAAVTGDLVLRAGNGSTGTSTGFTVEDLTIDGNASFFGSGDTKTLYGLYIGANAGYVTNAAIRRVEATNCKTYAFDILRADGTILEDCVAHDNGFSTGTNNDCDGFSLFSNDCTAVRCASYSNAVHGFAVGHASDGYQRIRVLECRGYSNGQDGANLRDALTNSEVRGGSYRANTRNGITVTGSATGNVISGVRVTDNTTYGVRFSTATNNVLTSCSLTGNKTGAGTAGEVHLDTTATGNVIVGNEIVTTLATNCIREGAAGVDVGNVIRGNRLSHTSGTGSLVRCYSVIDIEGTGSPESAVNAGIGSTYRRTDGSSNTSLYVKESGTSTTGWTAVGSGGVTSVDGNTGAITASQLLTSIKTVDGAGSGLDADLLDGSSSAAFVQVANNLSDVTAATARTNLGISATNTPITDTGGYFTGTEVETALQELGAGAGLSTVLAEKFGGVTVPARSLDRFAAGPTIKTAKLNAGGGINNSVTSITIDNASLLTSGVKQIIRIDDEEMFVTAGMGTTSLTVERGKNGTTAASHSDGAVVRVSRVVNVVTLGDSISQGTVGNFDTYTSRLRRMLGGLMGGSLGLGFQPLWRCGGLTVTDGVTTNADATVTSATACFTTQDVGRGISGTNIPSGATISSINSSTSVEISAAATGTGSGITLTLGSYVSSVLVSNTGREWTLVGTWSQGSTLNDWDMAPHGFTLSATAGTGNYAIWWRPDNETVKQIDVYWVDIAIGGSWSYSVDGGSTWVDNPNTKTNPSPSVLKKTKILVNNPTSFRIRAANAAGTGSLTVFVGIDVWNQAEDFGNTRGVKVHSLGKDGDSLKTLVRSRTYTDGVTNGTTTLTSATAGFVTGSTGDVGYNIRGTNIPNNTTISTVGSTSSLTLSQSATGSGTNDIWIQGTHGDWAALFDGWSASLVPDLVIAGPFSNDASTSITLGGGNVTSFGYALDTFHTRLSYVDRVMVAPYEQGGVRLDGTNATATIQQNFRTKLSNQSAAYSVANLDFFEAYVKEGYADYAAANTAGLMTDTLHPSALGYRDMAARMVRLLLLFGPLGGPTVRPVLQSDYSTAGKYLAATATGVASQAWPPSTLVYVGAQSQVSVTGSDASLLSTSGTQTIPARISTGDVLLIEFWATLVQNQGGAAVWTPKLKFGATTVLSVATASIGNSASTRRLLGRIRILFTAVNAQRIYTEYNFSTAGSTAAYSASSIIESATSSVDFSSAQSMDLTVLTGTTGGTQNITLDQLTVTHLPYRPA